jgi:hypothetical protein
MRWDVLDPGWLDRAVATFHARGVPVFALVESWEEADLRRRFAGQRTLAQLTGPLAVTADGELRLYSLWPGGPSPESARIPHAPDQDCQAMSARFPTPEAVRRLVNR